MPHFSKYLYCAILLCFFTLAASGHPAFCATAPGNDALRHRIESFSVMLAEEQTNIERTASLIENTKGQLSELLNSYQQLFISRTASSSSPVDRKQFEASLAKLSGRDSNLVDDMNAAMDAALVRVELFESYVQLAASTRAAAPSLHDEYGHVWNDTALLQRTSLEQISQLKGLRSEADQLLDRMGKIRKGEKTLYELWGQYLFVGKEPIFSSEFWERVLPSRTWLTFKYSEVRDAATALRSNGLKFLFLLLTLLILGMTAKRVLQRNLALQPGSERSLPRVRFYSVLATVCLSLFLATRITFPTGMEPLASLAAGLFLFCILKLAKHLCTDRHLTAYGHSRLAFLFVCSAQLLILGLPSRSTTLVYLCVILALWGKDTVSAWRRQGQRLSATAMRGGSLAPLFALAAFGYGRFACLLTILWCLAIFVRAAGTLWSQVLFLGTEKSTKLQKGLSRSLLVPLGWAGVFALAYWWIVDFFGKDAVSSILNNKATIGDYSLHLKDVLTLFILFFLTKHCIAAFKVSIEHVGSRWQKAKRGAVPSIQTLVTYAIWSLFSLVALRILGVNLTSITVIAGGLSVGIGFGMQNVVNNFISGLILLFGRSIQQGDIIEMNSVWCTVKKINIRTTLVETFESAVIMIPNSDLVTTQVTNWTKNNPSLRRDILVGVAYGSDTEKVKQTLTRIAEEHPHVLKSPAAYVHFNDFGSSSLDFILRVWIDDIENTIRATSELRFAIDAAFRREGIEIAFPQMDVHFKTAPALAEHLAQGKGLD